MPASELEPSRYREIVARVQADMIFQHGFTDTSMRSHILPTLRWNVPALCLFACPAPLVRGKPRRPGPPDRWAAFDAHTGALRLFAFAEMFAFTPEPLPSLEEGDRAVPQTMAEARQLAGETSELLSLLAPKFLAGTDPALQADGKGRLLELLRSAPDGLYPWERVLAPDFYDWLDKG